MTQIKLDKHSLIGTCLRLPLMVDATRLAQEIDSIPLELWGEQRSSVHTDVDAIFVKGFPPLQRKPDDERPILNTLPYVRQIIYDQLPGRPAKCVIAKLKPLGMIIMHRDGHVDDPANEDLYFYNYFSQTLRIHIPVITNDKVQFFCNGEFFRMPAGEVWTVNNLSDHGVLNDHPSQARTHMIVDLNPDAALMELLAQSERVKGETNDLALAQLLETSEAPHSSPYAQGKQLPA